MSPWERWNWLLWAIWLVFLLLPAWSVLSEADASPAWKAAGLSIVVAFGVAYAVGARRVMGSGTRSALPVLGLLVALAAVSILVIGTDAVSFSPFLVSFAAFTLPRPWHWVFGLTTVVAVVATLVLTGSMSEWSYFLFILVAIGFGVNIARLLMEQSRGFEALRRGLALSEERERVARDVHDVLGHSLTVISVKAGLAERLIEADPGRAAREVADIARISREALGEIRATVGGLRAAHLADELEGARESLASAGIAADLPTDPQVVDPSHRAVLGWVLREAVTNVVRHSHAGRCRVILTPHTLVVEDDGVGVEDARMGNGLRGLRERVLLAGGEVSLSPGGNGRGTRLEVSWQP